jgi:hypothetical protein
MGEGLDFVVELFGGSMRIFQADNLEDAYRKANRENGTDNVSRVRMATEADRKWYAMKVGSVHRAYSGGMPFSKCRRCGGDKEVSVEGEWLGALARSWVVCPECHGTGRLQPFASILVKDAYIAKLRGMTPEDVYAEGYNSYPEYVRALLAINAGRFSFDEQCSPGDLEPWVVEFGLWVPKE